VPRAAATRYLVAASLNELTRGLAHSASWFDPRTRAPDQLDWLPDDVTSSVRLEPALPGW